MVNKLIKKGELKQTAICKWSDIHKMTNNKTSVKPASALERDIHGKYPSSVVFYIILHQV